MRNPSGRPEHYLQGRGVPHALTALQSEGSSTWHRPLLEGPVICSGLDEGMNNTRHLGSDGDGCLAPQILVLAIFGNVPTEAIAQAVVALTDRDLAQLAKRFGASVRCRTSTGVLCPRTCPD